MPARSWRTEKARLEEARTEVSEAEAELADAKADFSDAQEDAAALEMQDWILSGRNDVGDIRSIDNVVDAVRGMSLSMSVVFLLVACVVCYAAITRMVNEQITLIGAQKALGFTTREILMHYMRYNALCAVLERCLGWVVAVVVVETLVLDVLYPFLPHRDHTARLLLAQRLIEHGDLSGGVPGVRVSGLPAGSSGFPQPCCCAASCPPRPGRIALKSGTATVASTSIPAPSSKTCSATRGA